MKQLAVLAVLICTGQAQLVSRCVTDGSRVQLQCPVEGEEYDYYINWDMYHKDGNNLYDYSQEEDTLSFNATWSGTGYDVLHVSCDDGEEQDYYALFIVTNQHNSVLPISPILHKENNTTLNLSWENPITTFNDGHDVYYNYTVTVNVTDGYTVTLSVDIEAHIPKTSLLLPDLAGLQCKQVNIGIALPGNCAERKISGSLLIVPQPFQQNVTIHSLFSPNGEWKQVHISFTPPQLCPLQTASYLLRFDDGNEEWSRGPLAISDNSQTVHVYLSKDMEPQLKLDKNYIVNIVLITEYGNASSAANFSTHPLLAVGKLRVVYYNQTSVHVAWVNPSTIGSSFYYTITVTHNSSGRIIGSFREENPFVSIDLDGYQCERVLIQVAIFGKEDSAESVEAVLPSYSVKFVQEVQVETSLTKDNNIREAEISFIPPLACEFQTSSYMLTISDGNKTWTNTRDPVAIINTSKPVEVEMESGFLMDTDYLVTITVFTEYANISSNRTFRFEIPVTEDKPNSTVTNECCVTGVSSTLVGGVVGGVVFLLILVLLCGFGSGIVVVYILRQRKKRKQNTGNRTQRCMVSNPIYEGSDRFYEELPDCLPSSEPFSAKASASIPPNIPPMRKMDPQEMKNISESEKEAMECKLDRAPPSSLDTHSLSSQHGETEDCYTVMSPAGTLTVLPRNRHSAGSQLGGSFPWPMGGTL